RDALLDASPAPAITMPPLNDAMRAVLTNENCVYGTPDELYAALVAAAPAISESEDARDAARYRWLRDKHDGDGPTAAVRCLTGPFFNAAIRGERLDAAIDAARKGEKS
ncbi:hypothetical protein, partial [Burkholderia gladioli]